MAATLSFFGDAKPLGAARTVPGTMSRPAAPSAKRVASAPMSGPNKRPKKLDLHAKENEPITPQASSEGGSRPTAFKIPALPARLSQAPLTPTTSTVAASSSSPRHLATSSPQRQSSRRVVDPSQHVRLESGTTLVFGRHHTRGRRPEVGPAPAAAVAQLVNKTHPARTIILERAAKHASRVHAAAELVSEGDRSVVRLVVLGQNGLRVRYAGERTKLRRLSPGAVEMFSSERTLEIDFYGAALTMRAHDDADETEDEHLFTPNYGPVEPTSAPSPLSLPPSSPPLLPHDISDGELSDAAPPRVPPSDEAAPTPFADRVQRSESRSSSPLSEPEQESSTPTDEAVRPAPPPPNAVAVKQELIEATSGVAPAPSRGASRPGTPGPAKGHKSRAATPAAEPIPPIPESLDMPALLASTVVFSGSSKLSLPDLVKSLLESQPSLRAHGSEHIWAAWAGGELDTNPMFGKITRNGRDAKGAPLLPHYYYNPANDPDAARAKELGGLVRPLRATQRGGGRAIDWRPVGGGRRR